MTKVALPRKGLHPPTMDAKVLLANVNTERRKQQTIEQWQLVQQMTRRKM
jgi:hypothetical protein